ncbi:sugar phosphate isomerase/epimerase family protein [Streptomyces spongiae]|uniref:sugar phosphate isomerase/epimerase family protein n=1 Tax=Streptomyces spongiae TaxID=565072 RepID=UPI00389AC4A1
MVEAPGHGGDGQDSGPRPSAAPLRFGYGTNGFTDHRLEDVVWVLADLGYDGLALTLDQGHLDPYSDALPRRVSHIARLLNAAGMTVTIETGAPYLLDPWRPHHPNLMSEAREDREVRIDLLRRASWIAQELGSPTVQLASGPAPAGLDEEIAWRRLAAGCETVLEHAAPRGITLGFEPEPDTFVDTVTRCLRLRDLLGGHERFAITFDVGHAHCVEDAPVLDCLRLAEPHLVNVRIEDMVRGVHRHLEFGLGEIDFPPLLAELAAMGHQGLVSVEIQEGSAAAPDVARRCLDFLRSSLTNGT